MKNTIIFLGMAGVGKTSIGRMVSKKSCLPFYDTDKLILNEFNQPLDTIINTLGNDSFLALESQHVLNLSRKKCIISPGGSFIYSTDVINQIKKDVLFIYLYVSKIIIY